MKIINYFLLLTLILQPCIHANDSIWSSFGSWFSRNISTISICVGFGTIFTAFNEYRMRKNNSMLEKKINTDYRDFLEKMDAKAEQAVDKCLNTNKVNTWMDSMNQRMNELFKWQNMHLQEVNDNMHATAKNVYDQEQDRAMKKLLSVPQAQTFIAKQPKLIKNYTDLIHAILMAQHQRITTLERGMNPVQKKPLNDTFIFPQPDLSSSNPL